MTVAYNGKEYYAEEENEQISCEGCSFNKSDVADYDFCDCDDSYMIDYCYNQQIIWKEVKAPMLKKTKDEEPKFTVEQVLLAAGNYLKQNKPLMIFGYNYKPLSGVTAAITAILTDPNYRLYLELKTKYEA